VKDPACRVAPERGGPSRKRRPSPSSGTATKTPAHPRRPKISRISLKEHRRAAAEQERHPCTKRRQPDALRAGLWASGRPARSAQECLRVSSITSHRQGARSAGKSATLENPAHFQRAIRAAFAPAIVTNRPRHRRRLGGANRRRRDRGVERDAGLPAGA
jgi:hypothetical protein